MSASFSKLLPLLEQFEEHHFRALVAKSPALPPNTVTNAIRFVSIEPATGTRRAAVKDIGSSLLSGDELEYPVVVGVGVNYTQGGQIYPAPTPYHPSIIDFSPGMRMAANHALAACYRNPVTWTADPGFASHVPWLTDYILIATNLTPFITVQNWSGVEEAGTESAIIGAWPHTSHLDALFRLIGHHVDLWIGHWKSHWGTFHQWRRSMFINSWMTTYNLSAGGAISGKYAMEKAALGASREFHPLYKDTLPPDGRATGSTVVPLPPRVAL